MKYLKTFESYDTSINEELFGLSKIEKAIKKFKSDNESEFKSLKDAENKLPESKETLKATQDSLIAKLRKFSTTGGELFQLLKITKVDSDYNTVYNDLKSEITNINANDTRSAMQKIASGSTSGRQ